MLPRTIRRDLVFEVHISLRRFRILGLLRLGLLRLRLLPTLTRRLRGLLHRGRHFRERHRRIRLLLVIDLRDPASVGIDDCRRVRGLDAHLVGRNGGRGLNVMHVRAAKLGGETDDGSERAVEANVGRALHDDTLRGKRGRQHRESGRQE